MTAEERMTIWAAMSLLRQFGYHEAADQLEAVLDNETGQ